MSGITVGVDGPAVSFLTNQPIALSGGQAQ